MTEVDEVGSVGEGAGLPIFDDLALAIVLGSGLDIGWVEGELSGVIVVIVVLIILVVLIIVVSVSLVLVTILERC